MTTHHIKKQVLDIKLTSAEGSFLLQQQVSELYRHDLLPVIDAVFDEFSHPEQVLCIDRLALDLGRLDLTQLLNRGDALNELRVKLRDQLTDQLRERLDEKGREQAYAQNQKEQALLAYPTDMTAALTEGVDYYNVQQRTFELLHYYCIQGSLPWWGQQQNVRTLCRQYFEQQILKITVILRNR